MIQLTKGFAMIADDCCYTVGKPRQKADGRIVLDKPTYYSTAAQAVQGALKRAMRQGVADGSITILRQFTQEQERLRIGLERLIAPLDSGEARQSASEEQRAAIAERMKAAKLRQKRRLHRALLTRQPPRRVITYPSLRTAKRRHRL